ncbi:hypothetical protein AAHA92_10817 [Salvia divinorum]|uniref:Uncharacterized protein n=1 Tax=Salvia divinorum TaxID=28513 RepID=A0ABD1HWU7_SALDI
MPNFHSQFLNLKHKFSNFPPIINAYIIPQSPHFLTTTTIESMEVKSILALEHDNKETIPPFSLSKKPGPNEEKPKCALVKKKKKKWIRRPLRDVTNFYRASELWGLDSEVQSPVSVSVFSSCRKRNIVDDDDDDDGDEDQRVCSKILRKEYR